MQHKTCFKCRASKPLTEFYVHPQMGDGRLNKCKDCAKRDVAENYRKNIEHYVTYEKERSQRAERKAAANKYVQRRKERDPQRWRAHHLVQNAVRDGRLMPAPCEVCGSPKVQGHHDDYSKPLEVRWLCWTHHMAVHRKIARTPDVIPTRKVG